MECPSCFDLLSPGSVGSHILRRHSGRLVSHWVCGLCVFAANAFADALEHGLLHGHPVDKLRDLTSPANKSSQERVATAVEEQQLANLLPQSDYLSTQVGTMRPISKNESTSGEEPRELNQQICEESEDTGVDTEKEYGDCEDIAMRNLRQNADEMSVSSVCQDTEMPLVTTENSRPNHELKNVNSCCNQCGKAIVLTSRNKNRLRWQVGMALAHVGFCLGIFPYACSGCGRRVASQGNLAWHLKKNSSCPSASVIILEPAKNEELLRNGLALCFPQHSFTWNGFATTALSHGLASTAESHMESPCEPQKDNRQEMNHQEASDELTNEENGEQTESSCERETIEQGITNRYDEPELLPPELPDRPERAGVPKLIYSESTEGTKEGTGSATEQENSNSDDTMSHNIDQNSDEIPVSDGQDTEMSKVATENSQESNSELQKLKLLMNSCCNRCGKGIVLFKKSGTRISVNPNVFMALAHVGHCLSILPYACSRCGHRVSTKGNLNWHRKHVSACASASVIIPEPARHEERLRDGLVLCFPQHSFTWNGFASTEPVSEPTEPTVLTEPTELTKPADIASSSEQERESRVSRIDSGLGTTDQEATVGQTNEENHEQTESSCEMDTNEQEMANSCDEHEILPPELGEEPEREAVPNLTSQASIEGSNNEQPFISGSHLIEDQQNLESTSAVAQSSSNPNHEKRAADIPTLKCAKCEKVIRQGTESALSHVCSCLEIRPYACSNCDHRVNSRQNFCKHKKHNSGCADASRVLPDREENEGRLKAGLQLCFPSFDVTWSGFQTTENETSSAKFSGETALAEEANVEPTDTPDHVTASTQPEQGEHDTPQHDSEEEPTDSQSNEAWEEISVSPQPTEEKSGKVAIQSLKCAKCSRVLRDRRIDGAVSHVCSCLEIRPYACSNCDRRV